jgi:predicted Zn-dependent protease
MVFLLSSKDNLKEASAELVERFGLTVKEQGNTEVNGYPAIAMHAQQTSENQSISLVNYLIQKDDYIYVFLGLSNTADFSTYQPVLSQSMTGFSRLTDPAKLNVQPNRIQVKQIPNNMTLVQALNYYKIPDSQHNELAVVNGMELSDQLDKGTRIKILSK